MKPDLLKYFQAVSFVYNEWENYPEKKNTHFILSFQKEILPRVRSVWELSEERAIEAIEDAVSSYRVRNILAKRGLNKSVFSQLKLLSSRIS